MAEDTEPQKFVIDTPEKFAAWTGDIATWNDWCDEHGGTDSEPLDPERPVHPILQGKAAMALWQDGMGAWNAWVAKNPRAGIDFTGEHFDANGEYPQSTPLFDFRNFAFPHGSVSFVAAKFGDGEVSFKGAKFGEGEVYFLVAKFGKGNVSFEDARFGDGGVSFFGATFGEGNVSFFGATFGEGDVSFSYATFGEGDVSFFGATFGEGNVIFDKAALNKGDVDFTNARFGPGAVSLRNLAFQGVARFDNLRQLEVCTLFSFEGCSFDSLFTFSPRGEMGCPLDLRRTKLTHGVVLNDVKCRYAKVPASDWTARLSNWFFGYPLRTYERHRFFRRFHPLPPPAWPWLKKAADREDSQRFRRLKELAQNENNRAKALEFNAQELRSQRGHESHPLQDFLQFFYMLLSDYGRSVVRPLVAVVIVTGLFGVLYARLATNPALSSEKAAWAGFTYSGGNMFAFVPIGRSALEQSRIDLFGKDLPVPYELLWVGGFQSVLSVILLFLLGLGLRNMFRL